MELNKGQDLRVWNSSTIDHGSRIKPDVLTKELEAQLINKIIMQLEKNKMKETIKCHFNGPITVSLKTINNHVLIYNGDNNNHNEKLNPRPVKDFQKTHAPHKWQSKNGGGGKRHGDSQFTRISSNLVTQRGWNTLPLREEQFPKNPDVPDNHLNVLPNTTIPSIGSIPTTRENKTIHLPQITVPEVPPTINIKELFQTLMASGLISAENKQNASVVNKEQKNSQIQPTHTSKNDPNLNLKLISFENPESLKVRQSALFIPMYAGNQCSSCGMRFSPKASTEYQQHLDWHFRQNRKRTGPNRYKLSRKWYHSISDWNNYEELEDSKAKEKNYFDQQIEAAKARQERKKIDIPTVLADSDKSEEYCHVCHDQFDQFFHEEEEQWHLKDAIRVNNKPYHPTCFEDYKEAPIEQTGSESKKDASVEKENPNSVIMIEDEDDGDLQQKNSAEYKILESIKNEDDKQQTEEPKKAREEFLENAEEEDDDDDVILNEIPPIVIVIDDDDD